MSLSRNWNRQEANPTRRLLLASSNASKASKDRSLQVLKRDWMLALAPHQERGGCCRQDMLCPSPEPRDNSSSRATLGESALE